MAVKVVRPWGVISCCGIHTHPVQLSGLDLYNKNIKLQFGRCSVRAVFAEALDILAQHGDLFKTFVENTVPLEEAPEWYVKFEVSIEGPSGGELFGC